ncbi:MAG: hypothetical protein AAB316_04170, partial [Bacteroidota bacterium]
MPDERNRNQNPDEEGRMNEPWSGTTDADREGGRANKPGQQGEQDYSKSSSGSGQEQPGRIGNQGADTTQGRQQGNRTGETQGNMGQPGNSDVDSSQTGNFQQGNTWTGQGDREGARGQNNPAAEGHGWSGSDKSGQSNLGGTMGSTRQQQGVMEGEGYAKDLEEDQYDEDVMDEDLNQGMEGGMKRDPNRGLG